jgi:hypothetical protein
MQIRRFRDQARKEFAINCDLVQFWTSSGDELTVAHFETATSVAVQGALDQMLHHLARGDGDTEPLGRVVPIYRKVHLSNVLGPAP